MRQRTFDTIVHILVCDVLIVLMSAALAAVFGVVTLIYVALFVGFSRSGQIDQIVLWSGCFFAALGALFGVVYRASHYRHGIDTLRHFWTIFATPVRVPHDEFDNTLRFAYDNCKSLFSAKPFHSWEEPKTPYRVIFFLSVSDAVLVKLSLDNPVPSDADDTVIGRLKRKPHFRVAV